MGAEPDRDGVAAPRTRHSLPQVPLPPPLPRTFQGRLLLAFVAVFVVAFGIVSVATVIALDANLRQQSRTTLEARARAVAAIVQVQAEVGSLQRHLLADRRLGRGRAQR